VAGGPIPAGAKVASITINGQVVVQDSSPGAPRDVASKIKSDLAILKDLQGKVKTIVDQTLDPSKLSQAKQDASSDQKTLDATSLVTELKAVDDCLAKVQAGSITYSVIFNQGASVSGAASSEVDLYNQLAKFKVDGRAALDVLRGIEQFSASLQSSIGTLQSLYTAIQKISSSAPIATLSFDAANNQAQPILVDANSKFSAYLSPTAQDFQKSHLGTYTITLEPYQSVHLRPSVGTIYSFVHTTNYGTAYNASGTLKITGNTSNYAAFSGVAAIDIVPDRFFDQGTEFFGQLGIAASSNVGILAGVGIRAYKAFSITAGVIYQRVNELKGGQYVGQTLAAASDLQTDKAFKAGFYLGLSAKLK
jgi:hypothetical protein